MEKELSGLTKLTQMAQQLHPIISTTTLLEFLSLPSNREILYFTSYI
jgi:hypothetical protein